MNGADEAAESKPNTILHALYFLKSTSEALSIPKRTVRWKHLPLLDKARLPDYPRLSSPFNSIQPLHPLLPSQSIQPVLHHTESVLNTQCNWQTPLCVPVPKKPNLGLLRQGRTKEEEEEEEEKEEEKEKKEEAKKTKEEEAKNEEKEEEAKWKWLLYIHAKISRAKIDEEIEEDAKEEEEKMEEEEEEKDEEEEEGKEGKEEEKVIEEEDDDDEET
ncbi:uncharacterized protein MONOS_10984 [Monocercomonoides exilis]|uniref:uncharacterized protein n=1 Tax=Monocercomonoides exilis TaxID=2049356 RepID=UPI00355A1360|nr:hypothetical protein MONOS_10984 [Monocercomonoides exilis]|eukprot:MONOS_10984.1-p1 / transcript=MONOS_10984.1 / gene=MONOS_10984 / organism=Monocercomonoides_exilis_PA203 / gene_product=unspecified product / transcript_product=unspecified product / location=Mono_scaffold00525:22445-23559(+) / protein_length=217 / sequence_SO=supercontig / SO=protein_coding / is_pseudo=false